MSHYLLNSRELKQPAKMFRLLNKQVPFKSMGYVLQVHHQRATRAISTAPVSSKFNSIQLYTDWLVQRFNSDGDGGHHDDGHHDTNDGDSDSKPASSEGTWGKISQLDKVYSETGFQIRGIVLIFLRTSRICD